MFGNIAVAVVCNVVAFMILFCGIFSGIKNGWKVSLIKLVLSVGSFFGAHFLTTTVSDKLLNITVETTTLGSLIIPKYLSLGSVNSFIFLALFLIFYMITIFVCKIVRACLINSLKDRKQNKIKMIRAKSINPKAERMARRAAKKELKREYNQLKNRFWSRFFGCIIGIIISACVSIIVLMPFGYAAPLMNRYGDKAYLEVGYKYTLNSLIPQSVYDWTINNDVSSEDNPSVEEPVIPEETENEEVVE